LEPKELGLEEGDVAVGFGNVHAVVLDLAHHLDEDFYALGLDYFLPDGLQDCVELARVAADEFELLIFLGDVLVELLHVFGEDDSGSESNHFYLLGFVDFILWLLLGREGVLDFIEKS
jgi:hypothetical protein